MELTPPPSGDPVEIVDFGEDEEDALEDITVGANSRRAMDIALSIVRITCNLLTGPMSFGERLKKCQENDRAKAWSVNVQPSRLEFATAGNVRLSSAGPLLTLQMLAPYGSFQPSPTFASIEVQVRNWMFGPRPRGPPLLDLDKTIFLPNVPAEVQQALNLSDRLKATAPSPDLVLQFFGDANGVPVHHCPGNVRPVPTAYNMAKFNELDYTAKMHLLAFVEVQSGRDPRRLSSTICWLADLNDASANARNLGDLRRAESNRKHEAFQNWLKSDGPAARPFELVPEPDVHEATTAYRTGYPKADHLDRICEQLVDHVPPVHPLVQLKEDEVCTLWFDCNTTTTEDLAAFLIAAVKRMVYQCGAEFPWATEDLEIKLYRVWIDVVMKQGYLCRPGLTGIFDPATQLPIVVGVGAHHPLAASLAAHAEHGVPYSLDPPPNLAVESWFWNRFRGRYRPGSLLATVNELLPILLTFRDQLTGRGVFASHETLVPVTFTPAFGAAYGRNYVHPIEHAYGDEERAHRLRQALNVFRCPTSNAVPDHCLCSNCRNKLRVVRLAEAAHRVVYG